MNEPASSRHRAVLAACAALTAAGAGIVALWLSLAPAPTAPLSSQLARAQSPVTVTAAAAQAKDVWQLADEPSPLRHESAEPEHPHPITPAQQRLAPERSFVADLNAAMDQRDGATLRQTLDDYRREFPEDEQRLQTGYGVIAECLEHPGDESRAAAERFYSEQRGSTLRRWVRRVCLES